MSATTVCPLTELSGTVFSGRWGLLEPRRTFLTWHLRGRRVGRRPNFLGHDSGSLYYLPPMAPGRMHALTTSEVDVRFIADFDHLVVQLNRTELVQQLVLAIHGRDRVTK